MPMAVGSWTSSCRMRFMKRSRSGGVSRCRRPDLENFPSNSHRDGISRAGDDTASRQCSRGRRVVSEPRKKNPNREGRISAKLGTGARSRIRSLKRNPVSGARCSRGRTRLHHHAGSAIQPSMRRKPVRGERRLGRSAKRARVDGRADLWFSSGARACFFRMQENLCRCDGQQSRMGP